LFIPFRTVKPLHTLNVPLLKSFHMILHKSRNFHLLILLFILAIPSCNWGPYDPPPPDQNLILTHWIRDELRSVYLWEALMPDLDPDVYENPEAYFYDLLFTEDRFSRIFRDADALMASLEGVEKTTGITAQPYVYDQSKVVGIVEYVTPDTPAADSGISRGDIIYAIDGTSLTTENYYELYYQTTATLEFAGWDGTEFIPNDRQVELTAVEQSLNPVVHYEVIESGNQKVGYLVYTQFTAGSAGEWKVFLDDVLSGFSSAGIQELVVDLRYNPGGLVSICEHLASSIVPSSVYENKEVFYQTLWNDGYTDFWKEYDLDEDGEPDGDNSSALISRFPEPDVSLGLSRVFILTSGGTASASELLLTGLDPYMDVVQIGTATVGKCYASIPIEDNRNPKRHNWAMLPLVYKYANADGFTDFVDGIDPDYMAEENLLYASPFGSPEDPLLGKALELISGEPVLRKSAFSGPIPFRAMERPRRAVAEQLIILPDGF